MATLKYDTILDALRESDEGTATNGLPTGGTANQVLAKVDTTNYNAQWVDATTGGGAVDSVNGQTGVVVLDAAAVGAASALGADDNYVTDIEKANLHAPGSDNQDLSGLLPLTGGTITGNLIVQDATPTKSYGFSTSGSDLDLSGGGANLYISMWDDAAKTTDQK